MRVRERDGERERGTIFVKERKRNRKTKSDKKLEVEEIEEGTGHGIITNCKTESVSSLLVWRRV